MENDKNIKRFLTKFICRFSDDQFEEYPYNLTTKNILQKLFKYPVQNIFYWSEDTMSRKGHVLAIYKINDLFIKFHFFNIEDFFEDIESVELLNQRIACFFDYMEIYNTLNDIYVSTYSDVHLLNSFNQFKKSFCS